jgi:hypothetical protein
MTKPAKLPGRDWEAASPQAQSPTRLGMAAATVIEIAVR